MIGLKFPKPKKRKPKAPKPIPKVRAKPRRKAKESTKPAKAPKLPSRRKRIATRSKFKSNDNPFKTYRRRHTDAAIEAWAKQKATDRIMHPTEAEARMEAFLRVSGINFQREKIWPNGDHPVFSDFWLPAYNLTIEIDGPNHKSQTKYDKDRALWLARTWCVGTVRLTNRQVMSGQAEKFLTQALLKPLGMKS